MTEGAIRAAVRKLPDADYRVLRGLCGHHYKKYSGKASKKEACQRLAGKGLLSFHEVGSSWRVTIPSITYRAVDARGAP